MFRRLPLAISAGLVLALCGVSRPALAQREDQVVPAKGAPHRGTIADTGMSHDKVTIEVNGTPRQIEVREIVRIAFGGEPLELIAARNNVLQRNYNQALADLKKLDGQRIERVLVRQEIEYYKALCLCRLALAEGGDKKAAADAMLAFVSKAPQTYHFYEAAELLGDVAMAAGKFADAAKYFGPTGLGGAPSDWHDYQMRANYAGGRALAGEKKYEEALEKFKTVIDSGLSTPEAVKQKNLAQVGRGVCLAETGKAEEAEALLMDLINKNDPQDALLFARAYSALGRCYMKQNKPKEARMAYLHTDLLFSSDPDAHAESLYYLSKIWASLDKGDRAVAARNTLKERYAGSIWATLE